MTVTDLLSWVSLFVGVCSIALALFSVSQAKGAEKSSLANFEKTQALLQKNYEETQKVVQENYEKTKDVLAEIDKKAAVIDSVVQRNQEKMMETITNLINETMIPKKEDPGEQIGMEFLRGVLMNPAQAKESIAAVAEITKMFGNPSDKA